MAKLWWLIAIPILDLIFVTKMRELLGMQGLFLWLAAAALLGILAIRTNGFRLRPAAPLAEPAILDRVLVVAAGLLLIFPGPASDFAGLLLLVPPVRRKVIERLLGTFAGRWPEGLKGWRRGRRAGDGFPPPEEEREGGPKTGRTQGKYPGSEGARDVEFHQTAPESGNLKTNKR